MPYKIEKIFEKEYGKEKGDLIFYKWLNKHKKKKKGGVGLTILTVVVFFMFGILIIGLIFPDIAITRSSDSLDCYNASITDGNKIACLEVDSVVPIWIIALIMISGGVVIIKLIS